MMHYASQGVRNAARKGSNALIHHSGHNGPGGSTTTNQTSRAIHISSQIRNVLQAPHPPISFTLESIRPRNPPHKLFSASKNFLQRFFAHLTAPGLRVPTSVSEIGGAGARSLNTGVRGSTIQSGLSLPARHALRNNALQRQANTFLPRGPSPAPPRCGGVAQVGLGAARNFSTARPIFQNLAQNVPVAGRALYEIDWDIEMRKEHERMRLITRNGAKKAEKTSEMRKPNQNVQKRQVSVTSEEEGDSHESIIKQQDIEHYFPEAKVASVTTYLLIPLAPTPTSRLPLDPDISHTSAGWEPTLLPPLSYLGSLHASHSTHALRVSTLFTRLDQANVWARGGVHCSAYSQGHPHRRRRIKTDASEDEGVCTILKVEFVGWTKAEVRGVIGESGSGWCALEEIGHEEEDEGLSDMDSLSSELLEDQIFTPPFDTRLGFGGNEGIDPAQSLVLPTLDFSSSFLSSSASASTENVLSIPSEMESDPWADDYYPYSSSSGSSSYSDLLDLIIDPPSSNGWFGVGHGFGPSVRFSSQYESKSRGEEAEPREGMFY